jgi:glycosyltransferase involved in cell wall biosynthesis
MQQLAIVIPYYRLTYFEKTLQSLANQTDMRFHVYIGDDASAQPPTALLQKYESQLAFSYKRFDTNVGGRSLVQQWNRCLALVGHEKWVMIVGDDDLLGQNVVESFYAHLKTIAEQDISVVRFATKIIDNNNKPMSEVFLHPTTETAVEFLMRKFKGGTRSSMSEYIFNFEILKNVGIKDFPLAWSSDVLAVVECANNRPILTINEALVFFRWSGDNITSQPDSIEKNQGWFMFYAYLLKTYGKLYPKPLVDALFDRLEKTQFDHKKTPKRWLTIFFLYLKFSKWNRLVLIFFRALKSIK